MSGNFERGLKNSENVIPSASEESLAYSGRRFERFLTSFGMTRQENDQQSVKWWGALGVAMTVPFLASLFYFVLFSGQPFARAIYAATKVFTIAWPLLCVWFLPTLSWQSKNQLCRASASLADSLDGNRAGCPTIPDKRFQIISSGILIGSLIVAGMLFMMKTPMGHIVTAGASNIHRKVEQFGILQSYWVFALFLSVVNSLIEEYYWRWFVYGQLRKLLGVGLALLLANISFAAHHVVVLSQYFPMEWALLFGCAVGAGGAIWCMMFENQRTLLGAWISHLIVDLGIMTIGYKILLQNQPPHG